VGGNPRIGALVEEQLHRFNVIGVHLGLLREGLAGRLQVGALTQPYPNSLGQQRFDIGHTSDKYQLYAFLEGWMRSLAPADLSFAIRDLCTRYSVDLAALSREASMDWDDLGRLAADPLVTMASATVNYPVLSNLKDADALREMTMGQAVAQAAFRREVRHFAYPFGDRAAFRRQHVAMAEEVGFASAASAIPGIVETEGRSNLHALPRVAWDGRQRSLRAMRVILSGATFPPVKRVRSTGF